MDDAAGAAAGAMRAGANLTTAGATGHRTWEDFFAERLCERATALG